MVAGAAAGWCGWRSKPRASRGAVGAAGATSGVQAAHGQVATEPQSLSGSIRALFESSAKHPEIGPSVPQMLRRARTYAPLVANTPRWVEGAPGARVSLM